MNNQEMQSKLFKQYGLISLIYGLFFSLCLYKAGFGITYTIFAIGSLGFLGFIEYKTKNKEDYKWTDFLLNDNRKIGVRTFYIASIVLLAISIFLTSSHTVNVMSCLGIFLLTGCLLYISYLGASGDNPEKIAASIMKMSFLPLMKLPSPFIGLNAYISQKRGSVDIELQKKTRAILLGIVVAIPAVLTIIGLLSSADIIFSKFIDKFYIDINIAQWVKDLIAFIFWAFAAFISFYCIMAFTNKEEESFKDRETAIHKFNPLIMVPMGLILTLIYLIFCTIQLVYLLGHATLPNGYTYANYAHEGFYQLLFVCLINIFISSLVRSKFDKNRLLNILTLIICGCTYIMIFSSAYRMVLYIQAYSLTFLRLFVLWFLIVLTVCLTILILGFLKENIKVARNCLIAGTALYIIFAFSHPDYFIADYNVKNTHSSYYSYVYEDAENDGHFDYDVNYITYNLSLDAVPALVKNGELTVAEKMVNNYSKGSFDSDDFSYDISKIPDENNIFYVIKHFNLSAYIAKKSVQP